MTTVVSDPLLSENIAQISPSSLKIFPCAFASAPQIIKNTTGSPKLPTNIQACSLEFFGNDFRSLARTNLKEFEWQKSFLANRIYWNGNTVELQWLEHLWDHEN